MRLKRMIAMEQAAFAFHLAEQRRARIRREDVKGRAFEAIGLDPFGGALENGFVIAIETEHEAAVHLDAVFVKDADAARVIFGARRAFAGVGEIFVSE